MAYLNGIFGNVEGTTGNYPSVNRAYKEIEAPLYAGPTGDPYIVDSRIRFVVTEILFHQDDLGWSNDGYNAGGGTAPERYCFDNYGVSKCNSLNIFLIGRFQPDYGAVAGAGPGYFGPQSNFVIMQNLYFDFLNHLPGIYGPNHLGGTPWHGNRLLAHEIGHCLGLHHTWLTCNQFPDLDCPQTNSYCSPDSDPLCSNNVMGYSNTKSHFTPLQLGHIHEQLSANWRKRMLIDTYDGTQDITIAGIETWDYARTMRGNIIVEQGARLTIKCKVSMPIDGKVIVKQNGKLIIDGGMITNYSNCDNTFWKGIEVWGTSGATQSVVSGYRPQGYFELINGGIVENARTGVSNWKENDWNAIGGVIITRDGEFLNNKRAVQFMKHQNILPNGNPVANLSRFRNTSFKVDDDYIGDLEVDYPFAQVTLWGVDGVVFTSCDFENTSTVSSAEKRSKGIYSEDAHYIVSGSCSEIVQVGQPCPEESQVPSTFNGFYRGIEAARVSDARPIVVRNTLFENNMVGVELADLDYSEIIFSKFEMGGHPHEFGPNQVDFYENHLGIYSNKTRCFVIEENTFVKDEDALWPDNNGLYVYNSMQNSNNVYRNSFTGLESGGIGYQLNRSENGTIGLQFTCNNMFENKKDFIVGRSTFEENHDISGIRTNQGNISPDKPAMNVFSVPNGIPNDYTHWTINSDAIKRYVHTAGTAPNVNEITPNSMLLVQVQNQNNCPTNYNGGVKPSKGNLITEWVTKSNSYHSLLYTYKQLIDDGNTDAAVDEVMSAWPNAAWELRDQLMARSPNNSETVLIAAATREIMPHAMLLEVLLENPDALRSGSVIRYVETQLSNPMPSYMIDILMAARDQSTMRTTMENSLSAQHEEMSRNYRFIVQHYSGDTLNEFQSDSLLFWLGKMHSPTGLYNLAGKHLSMGNHTTAINILDSIPVNYKLSYGETAEWNALKSLFQLVIDAEGANRSIARLDSSEIAQLHSLASDDEGGIGALRARKALCFFYDICLEGPLLTKSFSDNKNKPQVPPLNELLAELDKIDVFPNPATDYVTFSFNFFKQDTPKYIRLYNQSGAQIQSFALGEVKEGQQLWDTRKLKPGIYLYEVYDDKRKTTAGKVVIQ